jgi:predicted nucleotidyltransferase
LKERGHDIKAVTKTKNNEKKTLKKPKLRKNMPFTAVLPELTSIILNSTDKSVIQKIYLFGSYAYGKPTKDSDLDICVVLDNVENQLDINIDISKALSYKEIFNFDLLVYKEEQFYNSNNYKSIENTIINKGRIIYER